MRRGWKYIHTKDDRDELYDLEADPAEKRSLAAEPAFAEKRKELRERLADFMRETGDRMGLDT